MISFLTRLINHTLSSSKDGVFSFSRVGSAIALVAGLVWVSFIVVTTHALPDLGGLTCFITSLYGVNKLSYALTPKDRDRS